MQVPMKPPPWTDDEHGIELLAPPVCRRCQYLPSTSFVSSSGEGRWMESVVAEREEDDGDDDDDDGVEEVARAQTAAEEDSRSLINKGSGSLRRITEVGEEAEHEMREESSVSGTVKRKRSGRPRPLRVGKKRRAEGDVGDVRWPGDDVQHVTRLLPEEASEDTERCIAADTIDTAVQELLADKTAEDPVPASTPTTTYDPVHGPSDEPHAHTRGVDGPLPDRASPPPSEPANQLPSRPSSPTGTTSPKRATVPTPRADASAPHNDPNLNPYPTSPSPPSSSLLTKLTRLLTTHLLLRRQRQRQRQPSMSTPTPRCCAACRLPLLADPSTSTAIPTTTTPAPVRGPFNTLYHAHCMRCASCDRVLQGGTSWFERDGGGALEVSCRRCWRERRFAAGWGVREVDEGEMGLGFVG